MPIPHTRHPMQWMKRRIETNKHLTDEGRSHLNYWHRDLAALIPHDPRSQAIGQIAVLSYSKVVELEEALLNLAATSDASIALESSLFRWAKQLSYFLRLTGLRGAMNKKTGKGKEIFGAAPSRGSVTVNKGSLDSDDSTPTGPEDGEMDEEESPEDAAA